ncbi:MAG TPA: metallophosphoesterase, partial [Flavisolibacter sp.]|nr:metallophosphoesterase [Flavisolibacter sp.]
SSNDNTLIAFASDTQAPMLVETILLRSHKNKLATRLLFKDILGHHPAAFFLLGDVVNLGYSNRQWKPIDSYLEALRNNGIEIHAILGNHEVMGRPLIGQQKFQKRFPGHVRTGYLQVYDAVAVVLLNSNFNTLSKKEDLQQLEWYESTLKRLDEDPAIKFIITGCHHSPFTNSRVVAPSIAVQQKFVPLFQHSKKSQLFLSGHCHAFEHYMVGGKDFMVIGGGGGLRQPLRQGIGALTDLAADYKPLFHYLTVQRLADQLQVRSYQIKPDFSGFEEGLKTSIKKHTETMVPEGHIITSAAE